MCIRKIIILTLCITILISVKSMAGEETNTQKKEFKEMLKELNMTEEQWASEHAEQLNVTKYFFELKAKNKLPGVDKDARGKISTYKYKIDEKCWLGNESVSNYVKKCAKVYNTDFENSEKVIKYFFCIDKTQINFIAAYIKVDDCKWKKIENN